jgi:transposase InsO family protein
MKNHQGEFVVEKMCKALEVSRSTYYDWLKRKPSKLSCENKALKAEIQTLYHQSKGRLGSPKLTIELRDRGIRVSRPRVARLMKQLGIRSIISKKFRVMTTDSNHSAYPFGKPVKQRFYSTETR